MGMSRWDVSSHGHVIPFYATNMAVRNEREVFGVDFMPLRPPMLDRAARERLPARFGEVKSKKYRVLQTQTDAYVGSYEA